jgi:hypothetical protein
MSRAGRKVTAEYRAPRRPGDEGYTVMMRLTSHRAALFTPDEADALATQLRLAAAEARGKAGLPFRPVPRIDLTGLDDAA